MRVLLPFLFLCLFFSLHAQAPLQLEQTEPQQPYTHLDFKNNPAHFQFAIVTDRTGGHRPGVFETAVHKLNLLQPEFVMSVGDLIEGYTEDMDILQQEWKEFDGFVDQLKMPFFYVPGNHNITNQVMEDLWKERFGRTYYHFVYKEVLFLCLNSEDQHRGSNQGTISDAQYDYIRQTLAANADVRWTLVFMHQPLWVQDAETLRWKEVEALLADRPHTVFAGHRHNYVKYERNDNRYFMLATTGGGSSLRGPRMGEFDHVVWVTMTEAGPLIANLQLEGIWDENVMTEDTRMLIDAMVAKQAFQFEPLYLEDANFDKGTMRIRVRNDENVPMNIHFRQGFSWDLVGSVATEEAVIAPNAQQTFQLEMQ
ncbi:MAG: metallophosphoesterase, partial [Phaeodactylibacter sp.]|nr:metallophosphoesterase [Phaeodactylibacter sp.]